MRYVQEFRNPDAARALTAQLHDVAARLPHGKGVTIMEVCGTHTMAIARHGIRDLLPTNVRLISGPGCPVCVTPTGYIDAAIQLARQGATLMTFGDMLRVPGSSGSLASCRSEGPDIRLCTSPAQLLTWAREAPEREFVFLAIGFETTMAPILATLDRAIAADTPNVSLLTAFKCVPPALRALLTMPDLKLDAFLCPAHVSAIIGAEAYQPFAQEFGVPCVIAGFEPLDILHGLLGILEQCAEGRAQVDNRYARVVKPHGNPRAQALIRQYTVDDDAEWRGLGRLPASGRRLRPELARYDAAHRYPLAVKPCPPPSGCRCGDVLVGRLRPPACPAFGTRCTPEHPVGPCMVSSEGACAAEHTYVRRTEGVMA